MNNFKSSLFIWFIVTIYFLFNFTLGNSVISLISLGLIGSIYLVKERKYLQLIYAIFIILVLYDYKYSFYMPLFIYCLIGESYIINFVLVAISLIINIFYIENEYALYSTIIFLISIALKIKDIENYKLEKRYRDFTIDSKEKQLKLQSENERLIEAQDKGIELAISNERNRIARDIHDGVGHIISRTILQIGAILITEKDIKKKEPLEKVKASLDESMRELRRSLHNLQEDTINLKEELEKIINKYTFSEIVFNYSIEEIKNLNFNYSIIYIVNESLNNIIKHSNADLVEINLRETEDNIYILIKDNGSIKRDIKYGIGLNSIEARVKTINGNLQISNENGFRIFINIEKEEV